MRRISFLNCGVIAGALLAAAMVGGCAQVNAEHMVSAAPAKAAAAPGTGFVAIEAFEQNRQIGRGVNVLSEDPGWSDPAHARFKPKYFAMIKAAGFDSVRIVMNAFEHMNPYYVIESSWLERLDLMVNTALDAGLTVILDEHDFVYCGQDPKGCIPKLNAFWAQVAPRYKNHSGKLIFEILNEPHLKFTPEMWNAQIMQTLPIIRATNPTRNVIIGPGSWYNLNFLDKLELPVGDRHIIASFHYYAPMEFTHQGSPWVTQYKLTHQNWGSDAEIAQLNKDFDTAKAWGEKWDRPIYLGEFGAYETAPMDGRVRYTAAVARAAEARGFSWGYWQFDKDFVVYDIAKEQWVEPILNALVPPAK